MTTEKVAAAQADDNAPALERRTLHFAFLTTGSWSRNGGILRPRELGRALCDLGHRVTYIVDDLPPNRDSLQTHPRAEVRYVRRADPARTILERRRVLRDLSPDFASLLNGNPGAALAAWGNRRCRILSDWDEWPNPHHSLSRRMILSITETWAVRRSVLLTAASEETRKLLQQRCGRPVLYLPSGHFLSEPGTTSCPFPTPTAVYMGTLYETRDDDIVFEAFRILRSRDALPPAVIVGGGPHLPHWDRFVRRHGLSSVRFTGYLRGVELWRHLRHAHVLLLPLRDTAVNRSRCPGKVYCYAQVRRPVIATAVGEVVPVLGDKAIYTECTPEAFADAIQRAMQQPRLEDVDYGIENHTFLERATSLLAALQACAAAPGGTRRGNGA